MRRETLEQQLDENPRDAAAFLVYADFLLEQGNPHGELIRLQHAQKQDLAVETRDRELREQLLPALAQHRTRWELGFPRDVDLLWVNDLPTVADGLSSPLSRFVESVRLSDYLLSDDLEALARLLGALPRLETLTLANNLEVMRGGQVLVNQLVVLGPALPKLRCLRLELKNCREVVSVLPPFPQLKTLALKGTLLVPDDAQALKLARAHLPADCMLRLEDTNCSFDAEDAIKDVWLCENTGLDAPGLLVVAPSRHKGRCVKSGKQLRIGGHFACDLQLEGCSLGHVHSVFDANTLRPAGELGVRPRALKDAELVRLGDATLRYCDDLASARAALRR